MKATEVQVLAALDPGESYVEPKFLLVETARGDDGEKRERTVTINALLFLAVAATRARAAKGGRQIDGAHESPQARAFDAQREPAYVFYLSYVVASLSSCSSW